MEVTSYLLAEMQATVLDDGSNWKTLVETLGLKGQQSLVDEGHPNPIPFLRMTDRITKTFSVLCPQHSPLKSFDTEPIPPAVLEIIGLVFKEGYFTIDELSVQYRAGHPDPILVGTKKIDKTTETFLIAQWGKEKMTLEHAEHNAKAMAKEKFIAELTSARDEADTALRNPDAYVDKAFNGGWVNVAGVYVN